MDRENKGEDKMRKKLMGFRYKIIEYTYNKDDVRICSTIHLFDSRIRYFFLILYFKIRHIEYDILRDNTTN